MTAVHQRASITAEQAWTIVEAAERRAKETGHRFAIAVVDESGTLTAFVRQDGAKLNAVGIAQDKAYTAAASRMSTEQWSTVLAQDPVLRAGAPTGIARMMPLGGGLPLVVDGETVGAIGVSGAHWTDDVAVAEAGVAALG
jgi:uncharacterized protein GlcG (DUF336 family)